MATQKLGKNKDVAFKLKSKYRLDYGFENSIVIDVMIFLEAMETTYWIPILQHKAPMLLNTQQSQCEENFQFTPLFIFTVL